MKYLVVQDWPNTHGNHAGMVHMSDMLVEKYPGDYCKICKPIPLKKQSNSRYGRWLYIIKRKILISFFVDVWVKEYMPYCKPMLEQLKKGDEVFLLQYCSGGASQDVLARYIRKHYEGVKLYAMSHLTKSKYLEQGYNASVIRKWDSYVDKHILMGSSLTKFFIECGVDPPKISTGFHYVDNEYYKKNEEDIVIKDKPTIIAMGALQRDFKLLADIVNNTNNVNWIICKGLKPVDNLFHGDNVKLVGFVPEDELRALMAESDASINVLEDTVGSNVITTSLAMGLVVIVSDVGSIRDYVDSNCALFCENTVKSFTAAINKFASDPNKIVEMRRAALSKVSNITIDKVHQWFCSL